MSQLSSTAKKLDTLFRILHIGLSILSVCAVVCLLLIAAAFLFRLDPEMIGTGYENIDIGFLELEIASAFAPSKQLVLLQAAIQLALGFAAAMFGRTGVNYIRQILQPMTQGAPFHSIVSTNLRKLGKLSIILGIIANILKLAEQAMAVFLLDLPSLLISEKIVAITGNFTFDLSFLVLTAILYLLSYVFRYGQELQQLADETL